MRKLQQAFWLLKKEGFQLNFSKFLLVLSLSLGVAALVALDSFTQRIENTIKRDAKSLMAADIQIQSWRPFSNEVYKALESLNVSGDNLINQKDFVSSIRFKDDIYTVSARAVEGSSFPFYGEFKTEPQIKIDELKNQNSIILDKSFEPKGILLGDLVTLGKLQFKVVAFLEQEPQTVASAFALGPRVMIHTSQLPHTGLAGQGSRIFHQALIRSPLDPKKFKENFKVLVPDPHWRVITPEHANRQASKILDRLRAFLSFVAVTALLMGALGTYAVFRSMFLRKLDDYLTLRCLGYSTRTIEYFSTLQAIPIVVGGFSIGITAGWLTEGFINQWAEQVLNLDLASINRTPTALQAILLTGLSVFMAIYFPTREALRVPVAMVIRGLDSHQVGMSKKDSFLLLFLAVGIIFLITRNIKFGSSFVLGIAATAFLFFMSLKLLKKIMPYISERMKTFSLKQGLRQFIRGGASTELSVFTMGFSVFLLGLILFVGRSIQNQIDLSQKSKAPNVFMMGIPETENTSVKKLYPEITLTPVIQARIESIGSQDIKTDTTYSEDDSERFFQTREYFITKKTELDADERIVQGRTLFGNPIDGHLRVSLEESFAKRMNISLNSTLTLEISGVPMPAVVQSIRKVSWLNLKPNFFIAVHPEDISGAPFDSIGLYNAKDTDEIKQIQTQMSALYPQVTVIDGINLSQRLLTTVKQLSMSVSSLSLFCLISSFFVFMGLALARRYEIQKSLALWKCLGSRKLFILKVFGIEAFSTGFVGSSIGLTIALISNHFICLLLFDIPPMTIDLKIIGLILLVPGALLVLFQVAFTDNLFKQVTQKLLQTD
jgi:putative ABC transport system permease protein